MPRRFAKAKNPFNLLDEEFKNKVVGSKTDELQDLISEVTKNEELNLAAMKADQHLKEIRKEAAEAAKSYKDGTKANKQRLKFIIQVLSDRGDPKASEIVQLGVGA